MLVEQHRELVAVVALNGAFTPAFAPDALAHRERLDCGRLRDVSRIVVAAPARAAVTLAEVREQEGAAAVSVLGVASHHLEP